MSEENVKRLKENGVPLEPGSWRQRINERKAESLRCLDTLDVQAQLLIRDEVILAETGRRQKAKGRKIDLRRKWKASPFCLIPFSVVSQSD